MKIANTQYKCSTTWDGSYLSKLHKFSSLKSPPNRIDSAHNQRKSQRPIKISRFDKHIGGKQSCTQKLFYWLDFFARKCSSKIFEIRPVCTHQFVFAEQSAPWKTRLEAPRNWNPSNHPHRGVSRLLGFISSDPWGHSPLPEVCLPSIEKFPLSRPKPSPIK